VSQDDLDDPNAPPHLPKSNVVGNWVKHRAVRVVIPGELEEILGEGASRLEYFRVKQGAGCAYRRAVGGEKQVANVELIETHTPEDAFGILTVQCDSPETRGIGQITRVDKTDGYHLHCWQGFCYVHVYASAAEGQELQQGLAMLLSRIVLEMPSAALPSTAEIPLPEGWVRVAEWLVRSPHSLTGPGASRVPVEDVALVAELLDLDKDASLLVAALSPPDSQEVNYVWLARYSTPTDAENAYRRYSGSLDAPDQGRQLANSLLVAPVGTALLGTWAAEQESLMHLLPLIRAELSQP
jgi:hypothetical protein